MQKRMLLILILIALLMTACSVNVGGDRVNFNGNVSLDKGTYLTDEQDMTRSAVDVEMLDISNNAGNISVKKSTSSDISIKVIKRVKGTDEDVKKEIMENIDIAVDGSGNKLSVYPSTKDGKKDDLWKWAERMYKGAQVNIDFELEVPENIKVYEVNNNAGNISFDAIAGELDIVQNAGDINLNEVALTGTSSIRINAGNVIIDADISKAKKLSIVNTAGNVKLEMPKNSAFDLEAKMTAGNISGDFLSGTKINSGTYKQQINGGGTKVIVTTVAGNVTINSK